MKGTRISRSTAGRYRTSLSLAFLGALAAGCGDFQIPLPSGAWTRHTIDASFRGADGARAADVNNDGWADLAVGWEESGRVVVYLNPGPAQATGPWPSVVVGDAADIEDAVFVDLDADGNVDVVSCAEGDTRTVYVHWAPADPDDYLNAAAWETAPIPTTRNRQQWMFCAPAQVDGLAGIDLVLGGKNGGELGYLAAPGNPRNLSAWTWRAIVDVAWTMSIIPGDLDGDSDTDILYTDRKGADRGAYWLENRGGGLLGWAQYRIGTSEDEVMFMDFATVDGQIQAVFATDARAVVRLTPTTLLSAPWVATSSTWSDTFGTGKAARFADVDLDGLADVVFSCENASGRAGIGYLRQQTLLGVPLFTAEPISGDEGSKFDLVQLLDLDADGDLDVVTTEESSGLGVIWYENPTVP